MTPGPTDLRAAPSFTANLVVVHVGFVAFVVGGLVVIWLGHWRRWAFVRCFWFRMAHLTAIGVVAAESVVGVICPLTTWEDRLRLLAGGEHRYVGSFVQHWLHRFLYLELPEQVFTAAYVGFLLLVLFTCWAVPPQWPRRRRPANPGRS